MDDLIDSLHGCDVTPQVNSVHKEHPRFSQYKCKSTGSSQEERRKTVLEARKNKRYDLLSHLRKVEEEGSYDDRDDMDLEEEKMVYKKPYMYENFLMLSEWLVDVPEDFASSYYAMPCPVGKRRLVVTYHGQTKCYTKSGHFQRTFPSLLPGGNRRFRHLQVMLDCIYCQSDKTYYILDVVYWVNSSFMECETDFRFNWLKTKFVEDCPEATRTSSINPYRFIPLPHTSCDKESLTDMLQNQMTFPQEVDGILFYHKLTHYTHGTTPLVGWLKPFMLKEMLDVQVPDPYLALMPNQYHGINSHIEDYNKERKQIIDEREKKWRDKKASRGQNQMQIDKSPSKDEISEEMS